jgi:dTDP-4-amino-4,6-dideoxygalactose transaminase
MQRIPFVDLAAQYESLKPEIQAAIDEVFRAGTYIQGPAVDAFERAFAGKMDTAHAIGCANGTASLSLALEALGIGDGDEVLTVAHTFIATAEAICHVGAKPVFVDIEPAAYGMDAALLEAAITPRTRAIVPVHLYGAPCDMDPILAVARKHHLKVIEDAAQAHFATYRGGRVGSLGDCGSFSFYPGKNLGAYGDAGLISTNDRKLAALLKKLRDHGRTSKYVHDIIGYNQRMDALQAAMLSVKLQHIDSWIAARRKIAAQYDARLAPAGFKTIAPWPHSEPVYHLYVVEVSNRAAVVDALAREGIATGVHYPIPLHQQPALAGHGPHRPLPVTEKAAAHVLSLPVYPELTAVDVDRICDLFLKCAQP